jgi:hypothetical protein
MLLGSVVGQMFHVDTDFFYVQLCRFVNNIYIITKDVTRILSVFRWDVSCGKVLGIIQSQVVVWMGCFIT